MLCFLFCDSENLLNYHACPLFYYDFSFLIMCAPTPITVSTNESLYFSLSFFVSSVFLWDEPPPRRRQVRDNKAISYGGSQIQTNTPRRQGLATDLETKNDATPHKTSPSVRCSTFHLATLTVKGCDLLLDRESYVDGSYHPS